MKRDDALKNAQPGILAPVPRHARYLTFGLKQGARPQAALRALAAIAHGESCVVGLGAVLPFALQKRIEGLRPFPHHKSPVVEVSSSRAAQQRGLHSVPTGHSADCVSAEDTT